MYSGLTLMQIEVEVSDSVFPNRVCPDSYIVKEIGGIFQTGGFIKMRLPGNEYNQLAIVYLDASISYLGRSDRVRVLSVIFLFFIYCHFASQRYGR